MSPLLDILQHSLGVDRHGQGEQYRDHFVAGPGHSDFDTCLDAVSRGLMRHYANPNVVGGNVFIVTQAGKVFVAEHSPPAPILTRAQRRYRAYLDHDSGLEFIEWLQSYGRAIA